MTFHMYAMDGIVFLQLRKITLLSLPHLICQWLLMINCPSLKDSFVFTKSLFPVSSLTKFNLLLQLPLTPVWY